MSTKHHQAQLFLPLSVLAGAVMLLLVGTVLGLVNQFDKAAKDREETVVENGLLRRIEEVAAMVVPQVMWDDAVRHLDNLYDPQWAQQNIGQFLSDVCGFYGTFVLDPDDRPIFATEASSTVDPTSYAPFAPDALSLVQAVRSAEARRGSLAAFIQTGKILAPPIQASTLAIVQGELMILTATLVQPDFGTAMPAARAPIVVTAMPIDTPFIDAFSKRFMLDGAYIEKGQSRAHEHEAHAALRNDRGGYVATVSWRPQSPGSVLMHNVVIPILLVVALLGVIALFLYRRGRRMAQDIIKSEARAAHLAYYDALTGLPNRVSFFDRLGHALDQMRRDGRLVAIHSLDLDRFKDVNDCFGPQVGDELIVAISRRMAALCQPADTFARLGGDEFAIIQANATPASAAGLASRLMECVKEPVELGIGRIFTSGSAGLSLLSDGTVTPTDAFRQADLALYRAKAQGKAHWCLFETEMDEAIKNRRALETDLRDALSRNELDLFYQPQVNRHGQLVGVEALSRWTHPTRGSISPGFFVPVAEECGLIIDLGLFTLRRAFEDSRRWPGLKIAVNVSANQLRLSDFVTTLAALVDEMGVDPKQFELELTEGVLLGDDPMTLDTLKRLRQMGFAIALDDFGTGYSSLSYLKRYPITKIKIDRSFIVNLGADAEAVAVVGAIIKLARALKLSVIAEGVETAEQRERLIAVGCSEIQGFLVSRPVPAEDIDRLSAQRSAA